MRNLKGIYMLWLRDVKRFLRDKPRIIGAIAQPALFLFILGTGLGEGLTKSFARGSAAGNLAPGIDYLSFIYPGIIGMTVLFTSVFSAISIVWDREFGFLKEVLVAPISRSAVALGRALGGSTIAMLQGALMLIFAPFLGISLNIIMVLKLLFVMFMISFSLTSMGIVVAARIKSMEGFQMIMNFLVLPIFFLSGAMFPIIGLPSWMNKLVKLDPLTYGVDALRGVVLGAHQVKAAGEVLFEIPSYPLSLNLLIVASFGLAMIALAIFEFNRQE